MPETTYTYGPADFGSSFRSSQLMEEIKANVGLAAKFLRIDAESDSAGNLTTVGIVFSDALDQGEQDDLGLAGAAGAGTVVGDHAALSTAIKKRMTVSLKSGKKVTIAAVAPVWEHVGSTVGRVGFMVDNLNMAIAHITMAIKVSGTGNVGDTTPGAKIRLVEDDGTSEIVLKEHELPITNGWRPYEFSTSPGVDPSPRNLVNEYRLEASLDTAADAAVSVEIRSADLTVLEVVSL